MIFKEWVLTYSKIHRLIENVMPSMIKNIFLIPVFIVFYITAAAQWYNPISVNKRAMNLYQNAMNLALDGNYPESIQLLEDAIKIDKKFVDAWLSIAGIYGEMKQYDLSCLNYEKARELDREYFTDYNLPYSINLAGAGRFEDALLAIDEFLSIPSLNESSLKAGAYRRKTYEFAIEYAATQTDTGYIFNPVNLGDEVNSIFSEYYPTITIEGNQLVFTRRVNHYNEDFFGTELVNGKWTKSKGLLGNINSNMNEGAQNISQDGEWLIFTGCNFPEGYGSCDLYISYKTLDGWSSPMNLGPEINTEAWESAPSLSPDKQHLYFSSNRPGGYGANDIYVSTRQPNGRWSAPENLGPVINTPGSESTPFIHADNQTLYFTSDGHLGYGNNDIFKTQKEGNNWSKPINLGYPINTIEDEGSMVITADGITAYFASDRADSRGGLDLYTFELRPDIRPIRTLWVQGKVFDKETLKSLPSTIELTDLSTNEVVSRIQTGIESNYLITLPVGKDYAFSVNRKDYLFFSENFMLSENAPDSVYNIDIALQPLTKNATIVLNNIFFDVNKYTLKKESTAELNRLVQLLTDNPSLKISISGHTDSTGNEANNLQLSANRAKAVVEYLISRGVQSNRLQYEGLGSSQPVADNLSAEGRAKNRRTELKIIE